MPTLLLRFLPHILVAVAIVCAALWFSHARYAAGYQAAKVEEAAAIDRERLHQREVNEEISREHQDTVAALQSRVRSLSRRAPVRLCVEADQVRDATDTAGAADGAAAGSGVRTSGDIGPELYRYGGQCEQLRQQLLAIKNWQGRLREGH